MALWAFDLRQPERYLFLSFLWLAIPHPRTAVHARSVLCSLGPLGLSLFFAIFLSIRRISSTMSGNVKNTRVQDSRSRFPRSPTRGDPRPSIRTQVMRSMKTSRRGVAGLRHTRETKAAEETSARRLHLRFFFPERGSPQECEEKPVRFSQAY